MSWFSLDRWNLNSQRVKKAALKSRMWLLNPRFLTPDLELGPVSWFYYFIKVHQKEPEAVWQSFTPHSCWNAKPQFKKDLSSTSQWKSPTPTLEHLSEAKQYLHQLNPSSYRWTSFACHFHWARHVSITSDAKNVYKVDLPVTPLCYSSVIELRIHKEPIFAGQGSLIDKARQNVLKRKKKKSPEQFGFT